jgi:hypothetical protein
MSLAKKLLPGNSMNKLIPQEAGCACDNEAEVLYNMWKIVDALHDRTVTDESSCCSEQAVTIVVKDQRVTITYDDGQQFCYPPQLFE